MVKLLCVVVYAAVDAAVVAADVVIFATQQQVRGTEAASAFFIEHICFTEHRS